MPTSKRRTGGKGKGFDEWAAGPEADPEEVRRLKGEITKLNKRLQSAHTGESLIVQAVESAMAEPLRVKLPRPPPTGRRKLGGSEIAVLHVSDTQAHKVTESYNIEVLRDRLRLLARKVQLVTDARRTSAKIAECRLYLGGDMVEGENIFPGQAHEIDQPVFDQACRTTPEILLELLVNLLGIFDKVRVCCVVGNHGRAGRNDGTAKRTNWDRVTYDVLRLMALGSDTCPNRDMRKRVEFVIGESFYVVDKVYDWGNLIVHGDQIRGGFGGFPWYGFGKKVAGWIDSIPERFNYVYAGHFHTLASFTINRRMVLANGTTESDNVYAQEQLAACGDPVQRLAFYNAEHGLISDHGIYLAERSPGTRGA